jgi:hypothetical protein
MILLVAVLADCTSTGGQTRSTPGTDILCVTADYARNHLGDCNNR